MREPLTRRLSFGKVWSHIYELESFHIAAETEPDEVGRGCIALGAELRTQTKLDSAPGVASPWETLVHQLDMHLSRSQYKAIVHHLLLV